MVSKQRRIQLRKLAASKKKSQNSIKKQKQVKETIENEVIPKAKSLSSSPPANASKPRKNLETLEAQLRSAWGRIGTEKRMEIKRKKEEFRQKRIANLPFCRKQRNSPASDAEPIEPATSEPIPASSLTKARPGRKTGPRKIKAAEECSERQLRRRRSVLKEKQKELGVEDS
uniref:Uncharacterized protein n=1 Tax=Panagrolaimus sp. JU765 TaxID=591449 RepID=A0AC34Q3P4_9BILA